MFTLDKMLIKAQNKLEDGLKSWSKMTSEEQSKALKPLVGITMLIALRWIAGANLSKLTERLADAEFDVPVLTRKEARQIWGPVSVLVAGLAFRAGLASRSAKR